MNSFKRFLVQENLRKEIRLELCRRDFWDFCEYYDAEFFARRPFLKQISDAFMKIERKEINSLSVSMPPRAGKSYIASLFAAWSLAKHPMDSVMRNACTATLYDKFSYDTRAVIQSEKFKEIFPDVFLSHDKKNLDGWNLSTSRQVGYFGAGVGGTIIGFGATWLAITDDLYKSLKDALSPGTNRTVHQWKESAHDSRLEKDCRRIDIGTRWTIHDVIGKGIEANEYDLSIIIPALVKEGKTLVSFCEDVKTTEQYQKIKRKVSKEVWNGEYMQEPIEVEGLLFKKAELNYYRKSELRKEDAEAIIGYVDPADDGTDFYAFPMAHVFPKRVYITDVIFTQDNTDITTPRAMAMVKDQEIWKLEGGRRQLVKSIDYVRFETNGSGVLFKTYRKKIGSEKILKINNSASKHSRIINAFGFIKEFFWFLHPDDYEEDSDYDKFMHNLFQYPKIKTTEIKDDAPDAAAGLGKFAQSFYPELFYGEGDEETDEENNSDDDNT